MILVTARDSPQPTATSSLTFAGHQSPRCHHQCCSDMTLLAGGRARDVSIRSSTKRASILAAKSSTPKFGFITMKVPKFLESIASLKISRGLTRARHFGQRKVTYRIRQTLSVSPLVCWLITSPLYGPRPQHPKRRRRLVAI